MAAGKQRLIPTWVAMTPVALQQGFWARIVPCIRCRVNTHRWQLSIQLPARGVEVAGSQTCKRELGGWRTGEYSSGCCSAAGPCNCQ